ncbi:MAG: channel protein TolC [Comamonadaceae bacterium]|jgi:TolC family type I secretion outer membrane protein|nr:TolC family outer membrane protein [Rhodoferax sp.]TSA12017.1 MAG: channel protein TolC [Comamonadaceae bacterium]
MLHPTLSSAVQRLPFKPLLLCSLLLSLSGTVLSMDLLQAYQAAQQQDATILASRAAAQAGRERLPQARSQLLPNVAMSVGRNQNNLVNTTPNSLGQEQTSETHYPSLNRTLTVRQPLFRSYLAAQYRQAEAQVQEAEASLAQDEQNLAVRVSGAYFEAMLTHEQLALVLAQRTAYTTQLDAARKSLAAGSGTRTDVDDAQARLDMNAALEIEARQNVSYTLRQLEMLVNQPVDKLATLDVARLELLQPQPNVLQDWIARAETGNPQLQSLRAQVETSRQEVKKAGSGHYPTLDAVAQWSRSESENILNVASRYTNASVGLQLNIPIFSGGYVNSSVRQALAGQEHAEQALEAGRRDLGVRVYKEFRGMTENIPKVRALELALRSADQLVLSSRKSFQAGSRTVIDVLNAEQQRMVVLRDLAQARYMYLIARIRLLALVGAADDEAVAAINRMLKS